jgi:hypothetical protein
LIPPVLRDQAARVLREDLHYYLMDDVAYRKADGWEREAMRSLVVDPIRVDRPLPHRDGYINGQHRAQAMIDAGVRRALIERIDDSWRPY